MSKHTPGPWLIGETIATEAMCVIGDGDSVICEFSGSGETVDADASLIAAAPELLEALELLLHDRTPWTVQCAKEAIAKATGEQA